MTQKQKKIINAELVFHYRKLEYMVDAALECARFYVDRKDFDKANLFQYIADNVDREREKVFRALEEPNVQALIEEAYRMAGNR